MGKKQEFTGRNNLHERTSMRRKGKRKEKPTEAGIHGRKDAREKNSWNKSLRRKDLGEERPRKKDFGERDIEKES